MGGVTRAVFTATAGFVRRWDLAAAQRVTHFLANSRYVADRIRRCYGRESTVIYPPIDVHRSKVGVPGKHYLCAGRLVGYKRTELMIEACRRLGRTLRVAGTGPELAKLRKVATAGVIFLGEISTEVLWAEYACCRALLFAADEDFGMVPLEVQACGRPVVAYGAGGSLETVRGMGGRRTGVYFGEQTVESMMEGILRFEAADAEGAFESGAIREWAGTFRTEVFLERIREYVLAVMPESEAVMVPTGQPLRLQGAEKPAADEAI